VVYTVQVSSADLYEAVGVERDRPVTRDEVIAGRRRLFAYLAAHVHVDARSTPCPPEPPSPSDLSFVDKVDGFFAAARLTYRCPRAVEEASIRYDLFFDLDPRHQGLARIVFAGAGDEGREQVFRADARTLAIRRDLTVWDHVRDYLLLGMEHIFTGYDHIAFVFGLLVIAGRDGMRRGARRILTVVTAFTLAHSVTLILSALGVIALSPRVVEPAIALSIAYVGVENLLNPAPRFRWLLTFGFGLVHGFGFASVLREVGLPKKGLLLSLVSFNVGVEIGQLAVVAAVLPLLALVAQRERLRPWEPVAAAVGAVATFALFYRFDVAPAPLAVIIFGGAPLLVVLGRRWGYERVVRIGGSSVITGFAVLWFFERVLARSLLGGWLG
jgi:HupE/UreJ protein